ncbi:MAG: hypothetical protein DI534_16130 [Leifsonia xyli]|nr:MAG: hypothetical protein DI534_16130 [Leifsonia xyli]
MIEERRVIDAFKTSEITCVALLDDAFDPPTVPDEHMGAALDLFGQLTAGELATGVTISQPEIDAALEALSASEYAAEALQHGFARLFAAYVATGEDRFDPGGAFKSKKANNLTYVQPILALLRKCDPTLEIILCGSHESEMDDAARRAQLIFVDFFLNANLSSDGDPNDEQKESARAASLTRLKQLIEVHKTAPAEMPAVILMSSHDVEHRMEDFRKEVSADSGDIFAARFDFLPKKEVTKETNHIAIQGRALESLLGIVQSFAFGRAALLALREWKKGADAAVEDVWHEINALKLKDYAYLTRFRLAQEGMNLSEYLEWFFSECLNDAISRKVDWSHQAFDDIDRIDGPTATVRGAFDGATDQVAKMFDRVRVEKPRSTRRRNHRMGDLFIGKEGQDGRKVRAILTPDCDLIKRKNGKAKAIRVLTVGGVLRDIHADDAPLADFLLVDDKPQCIRWSLKDVRSYDFNQWPKPATDGRTWKFLGTLRPLYAYELRARTLDDLGRYGLNVPPAIGSSAAARVIVDGTAEDIEFLLADDGKAACSLVLSRGGADFTQAIFYESAVTRLLDELRKIPPDKMTKGGSRTSLENLQRKALDQDKLMEKLTEAGLAVGKDSVAGIKVTTKAVNRGRSGRPWCQIVLSNELISSVAA